MNLAARRKVKNKRRIESNAELELFRFISTAYAAARRFSRIRDEKRNIYSLLSSKIQSKARTHDETNADMRTKLHTNSNSNTNTYALYTKVNSFCTYVQNITTENESRINKTFPL